MSDTVSVEETNEQELKEAQEEQEAQEQREEELVPKVEEMLKEALGDAPEETTPGDEQETQEDDTGEKDADKGLEEKSEKEVDTTPSETEEVEAEKKDTTTQEKSEDEGLPNIYVQAAKRSNWTDEEINKFYEQSPELAVKTFAKLHESTNKLTNEFAAIGKAKRDKPAEVVKPVVEVEKPQVKSLDVSKIRTELGDDIADALEQQQSELAELKKRPEAAAEVSVPTGPSVAEQEAVGQQIDQFFSGPDMASYNEFYGAVEKGSRDWNTLTGNQVNRRWQVTQMADDIMAGAKVQGRVMNSQEAMELAHLSISEPVRSKAIRDDIKAKSTKRSKSLTLKPTGSKPAPKTGIKTEAELVAATEDRLSKLKI